VKRSVAPLLIGVALLLLWGGQLPTARAEESAAPKKAATQATPTPTSLAKRVEEGIAKGVAYLLGSQKKDGSWGSPRRNMGIDIYAPAPGSQQAFHVGSTALATSGLIAIESKDPKVAASIERAAAWLSEHYAVRRIRADTLYNTWAHMYALETFARLLAHEKDKEKRKVWTRAAEGCVKQLRRYEFVEGGWGYYNFSLKSQSPGQGSTSFSTATGLVALGLAQAQGIRVPEALVRNAVSVLRKCDRPDGAYAYSYRTAWWPTAGINKTGGSLARTPACLKALSIWDQEVDPKRYVQALEELETFGHFLRIARKYPRPHESWYSNSGYFCYYGYYYAALLTADVPAAQAKVFRAQIAGHMLDMQERDGSWWDYQLYGYHKAYGTGYALLTLAACRP
jgi:hypothetical protein